MLSTLLSHAHTLVVGVSLSNLDNYRRRVASTPSVPLVLGVIAEGRLRLRLPLLTALRNKHTEGTLQVPDRTCHLATRGCNIVSHDRTFHLLASSPPHLPKLSEINKPHFSSSFMISAQYNHPLPRLSRMREAWPISRIPNDHRLYRSPSAQCKCLEISVSSYGGDAVESYAKASSPNLSKLVIVKSSNMSSEADLRLYPPNPTSNCISSATFLQQTSFTCLRS